MKDFAEEYIHVEEERISLLGTYIVVDACGDSVEEIPEILTKTLEFGEKLVAKTCTCPKCKTGNRLQRLPTNFKCADVICDFCGYLARVKACTVADVDIPPDNIMGAAWGPQKKRMDAGIYFPLYIVALSKDQKKHAIWFRWFR